MQLAEALARQVAINGGLWVFAEGCSMEKAEFENCYWIAYMKGKVMVVSGTLGTCISSTVAGLTSSSIDMFMLHEALMGCDPKVTTLEQAPNPHLPVQLTLRMARGRRYRLVQRLPRQLPVFLRRAGTVARSMLHLLWSRAGGLSTLPSARRRGH